jgi:hypothetical protein
MTCLGLGGKAGGMNILYMTSWYLTTFLIYVIRPSRRHAHNVRYRYLGSLGQTHTCQMLM